MYELEILEKIKRLEREIEHLKTLEGGGGDYVDLSSAQTVGGVKTFTSIPVLPASNPTLDNQAVRKAYVDTQVADSVIPSARVYNSANISIPNNAATALTFNSERWDTDGIHSTTTNTGRLTCVTAGIYSIFGHIRFAANATGIRSVFIRLNGTTIIGSQLNHQSSAAIAELSIVTHYVLAVGNYVELMVYQNSGGALSVDAVGNSSPEFGMTYLGKAA